MAAFCPFWSGTSFRDKEAGGAKWGVAGAIGLPLCAGPAFSLQTLPTVRSLMRGWISFCDMTNVCGRNLSTIERT